MNSFAQDTRFNTPPLPDKSAARMSWFSELAGKAENLLNDFDEKTASVLQKNHKSDVMYAETQPWITPQTRRPFVRTPRKTPETRTNNYSPPRKSMNIRPTAKFTEGFKDPPKSAQRKNFKKNTTYGMHYPPHTMVMGDERLRVIDDEETVMQDYGRRKSLPLSKEMQDTALRNQQDSLKSDNEALKDEVNVCNQEISDLLDRLRAVEEDMKEATAKFDNLQKLYNNVKGERESLSSELEELKKTSRQSSPNPEYPDLPSAYRALEQDFHTVSERNRQLQEQVKEMETGKVSNSATQMKLENDLRFAHMTIDNLRAELEKARIECNRVQSDWDSYKLRVKSMLLSKDKEIQALQRSPDYSEGTKLLVEQVETLREDRSQLSCAVAKARDEHAEAVRRIEQLEARAHTAERLVAALREALREERTARGRAESQCVANNKELKTLQMESNQQLASMQSTLRDKENEIYKLRSARGRSATSVCPAADASALNVAEHERVFDTYSSEKVQLLTQALVAKQGRMDALIAENNNLKLHIEKIEAKHRLELSNIRTDQKVIQVTDGDALLKTRVGRRGYVANSVMSKVSLQLGVYMRRHPLFRFFIIMYMGALHVWVLVVLLTYTPEVHAPA